MKFFPIILNDARPANSAGKLFCLIRNKEDSSKPVEVLIYDVIGKDWDGTGFDAKDFVKNLEGLDEKRELKIRVNSRGGIVDEGIAIYNRLREWKGRTVAVVDGAAASIASVLIMGADEVHMPKSAQILIHEAHAVGFGDADDMRLLAQRLDSASDRIAGIYSEKCGKSREEMRNHMRKTSIFDGVQAKEMGLIDVLTDEVPLYNFLPGEISRFRVENGPTKTPTADDSGATAASPMKKKLLALLNKHGIKASDGKALDTLRLQELVALAEGAITNGKFSQDDFDTAITGQEHKEHKEKESDSSALTAKDVIDLRNELATERKAREEERKVRDGERKSRMTVEIDRLIENNQLPAATKDKAIARAMADETILDEYKALPSVPPGADPVIASVETVGSDPRDIAKAISKCSEPVKAWQRGNEIKMRAIAMASVRRGEIINANLGKLVPLWNTNTVDTELKRHVILQQVIKDFTRRVMPLRLFATVFENVPLEGTNKVQVPFYDLDTTASRSFSAGTGYTKVGNTTTDNREVEIGTGVTNGDRLFQDMSFTSEEIARQPYLKVLELAQLKTDKLGSDLVTDVLGIVTAANFGAAAKTTPAAAFDSDDIADLVLACKLWPEMGRGLLLDTAYHINCLKDPAFKAALNAASDAAIKEGKLNPRVMGFNYVENPTIPSNSENLVGFAAFQSAILVATAPVPPVAEVRNAGTTYSVVTDPQSGVAFEYRTFGDNTLDTAVHIVEVNYGFAKGNGNALKRIVSS